MMRVAVLAVPVAVAGLTLLLAELPWFRRSSLTDRLRPYGPAGRSGAHRAGPLSVQSFRDVIGPLVAGFGDRLRTTLGVHDSLAVTLERLHSPVDTTVFRLRQATWAAASLGAAVLLVLAATPPAAIGTLFVLGAPLLAFLAVEQRLERAALQRRTRVVDELPIVLEQLAMLLAAGYSLGSALGRLARRGDGAVAEDLSRVTNRVRQGLSEAEALREWAAISDLDEIRRLVDILVLDRHGADLGAMVSQEARAARRDAHRRLLETIERRAQLVWIPVTIATLVPGVLFMAIPFIEAMRNFAAL